MELFTIGHTNMSAEEFVSALTQNDLQVVIDVRSAPYSQYTVQFNRETLAATLAASGIEYLYAGDTLGGRPKDPALYLTGRVPPPGKADYLKLVDYTAVARRPSFQSALDRVCALGAERRTVLMCTEEDPRHCHRLHLIAPALQQRGVTVTHLRTRAPEPESPPDGPRQLPLF